MKTIILIMLVSIPILLFSQPWTGPDKNIQKYWRFRERLKNFVVPGNQQGCSEISSLRELYYDYNGNQINDAFLNFGDETQYLGHYIGMLSMEYKMEMDHGMNNTDITVKHTTQELAYALEAFNRLDETAEMWWDVWYNGNGINLSDLINNLNGFFIRNDVPDDFVNRGIENDLIENRLNSSYFPVDDGRIADKVKSAWTTDRYVTGDHFNYALPYEVDCHHFNGSSVGPAEESLDQVCQIMLGLALTVKCVNSGVSGLDNNGSAIVFADGISGISEEAKKIADRITFWIQSSHWTIMNPVTTSCVKGVVWDQLDNGDVSCKCLAGGAIFELFSYGLAIANSRIQTATMGSNLGDDAPTLLYYSTHYSNPPFSFNFPLDPILNGSESMWNGPLSNFLQVDEYKVMTLGAIGRVWGPASASVINNFCEYNTGDFYHFPLLYHFLYGGNLNSSSFLNDSYYRTMLDECECFNSHANDGNLIWSNYTGLMFGGFNTGTGISSETDNLSYLFYFNLYNLYNPSYLSDSGVNYGYIEPSKLCENDIIHTGFQYAINNNLPNNKILFIESDKKGFHAANSIIARGGDPSNPNHSLQLPYVIDNDNDNQPWPLSQANITFEAGNFVDLQPGFEAHEGVEFHATINPTLEAMTCSGRAPQHRNTTSTDTSLQSNQNKGTVMNQMSREELQQAFQQELQHQYDIQAQKEIAQAKKALKDSSFYYYSINPNPNLGTFTVTINTNSEISKTKITIYNIIGEMVFQSTIENKESIIDISSQAQGIYYVKMENENGLLKVEKIIKE